ncbi:hypothetical protein C8P68_102704 [Mucilaginibacter yixingensis]|uniref:Uncharacterized protein n=1 Tax=Mucilaginibacter yixingensis TaxID=1295612 RepID=A0A2T5JDN7_9SPHI|nr:hypothetical protein [Mucilaginibacter yixingensis]PTQ99874.1 hypothetical protein C8P68_102704 [Mucilaginibacter yixingensis]
MNNSFIPLILILATSFIIYMIRFSKGSKNSTSLITPPVKPSGPVVNDKLIIIQGENIAKARLAAKKFSEAYKLKDDGIKLRLTDLGDKKQVVTFPFDISFDAFCFAINFLKYPTDILWAAQITAWGTTRIGDSWITPEIAGEKAMFYLPENDTEYDMVLMTSSQNVLYKLGFSKSKAKQLPDFPEQPYHKPTVSLEQIASLPFEDIE